MTRITQKQDQVREFTRTNRRLACRFSQNVAAVPYRSLVSQHDNSPRGCFDNDTAAEEITGSSCATLGNTLGNELYSTSNCSSLYSDPSAARERGLGAVCGCSCPVISGLPSGPPLPFYGMRPNGSFYMAPLPAGRQCLMVHPCTLAKHGSHSCAFITSSVCDSNSATLLSTNRSYDDRYDFCYSERGIQLAVQRRRDFSGSDCNVWRVERRIRALYTAAQL